MKEKRIYSAKDGKSAHQVIRDITYSTDPADFHYMKVNVPCQYACPAFTNIPAYIRTLFEGRYDRSYELNRIVNVLPGVLGRVCSRPCETMCRHGEAELGEPVSICHIKRAASDFKESGHIYMEQLFAPLGKKVCVVGAGPSGLAAAHDLATVGFEVEILEALEKPGGMLYYGIPEFRLPRRIIQQEINGIIRLGVNLKTSIKVGQDVHLETLLQENDAVLITTGCYSPRKLRIPGEDLPGVFSGLDFVTEINSSRIPNIGKRTLVIGDGFTAFDCARLALRLGSESVEMCMLATEDDLRVTVDEIREAKREGVRIKGLMISNRIIGNRCVEGVEFLRTRPIGTNPDGTVAVDPIEGSDFILEADTVIVAIGQSPTPIDSISIKDPSSDFEIPSDGFVSSNSKLYAAGDFRTGPTTVIEAIAQGRKAAEKVAEDLTGKRFREWAVRIEESQITDRSRSWDFIAREEIPSIEDINQRLNPPESEVELGYTNDQAQRESQRCYLCYLHYEIDIDACIYCRYCIDVAPRDCIKLVKEIKTDQTGAIFGYEETSNWREVNAIMIDNSRCIRCGACVRVCPMDCISVSKVELVERILQKEMV